MKFCKFSSNRIIASIMISICLAGCGEHGISASSESTAGKDTESKTSLDRTKEITGKRDLKASITMPASALIVDAMPGITKALSDNINYAELREKAISSARHKDYSGPLFFDAVLREKYLSKLKIDRNLQDAEPLQVVGLLQMQKCNVLDSPEKKQNCMNDWLTYETAALYIIFAHMPVTGWAVEPSPYRPAMDGFAPLTKQEQEHLTNYLDAHMEIVDFANAIESELAGNLSRTTLKDPDDAKINIQRALFDIPSEKIRAASDQAFKDSRNSRLLGRSIPATTTGPEFSAGPLFYKFDQAGGSLKKNGVVWFGEGNLNGKKYEVALESSISTSLSKKRSGDQSQSVKGSTSNKAAAEVK